MGKYEQIEEFLVQRGNAKAARSDIAALARTHGPNAIALLAKIMGTGKAKPSVKVSAAKALLDRGYGQPTVHIDPSIEEDADLETTALAIMKKRGMLTETVVDATSPLVEAKEPKRLAALPAKTKKKAKKRRAKRPSK